MPDGVYVNAGHLAVITTAQDDSLAHPPSLREWMGRAAQYETRGRTKTATSRLFEDATRATGQDPVRAGLLAGIRQLRWCAKLPPVMTGPGHRRQARIRCRVPDITTSATTGYPEAPTREEAIAAMERVFRYVRVVNFREPVDRARWMSLALTLATRTAYETCQCSYIARRSRDSGKTETAHVAYGILYGASPRAAT